MNAKPNRPHPPMLTLGDIYYILFRHKWKILIIAGVGLLIGLLLPMAWPSVYESQAKLLIKYVTDSRVPTAPDGDGQKILVPDAAGRNIINTELQILTSMDLAQEVATNIGADKILGKTNANVLVAASVIHNNLFVEVPNNSDVISIVFKHKDPLVVRQVLSQVISSYLDRHAEIHRPGGAYDEFLQKETDHLRSSVADTEESLRKMKANLGIISLEDARKTFSDKIGKIQQDIYDSRESLTEHQAFVDELSKRIKLDALPTNNVAAASTTDTNSAPTDKIAEYKRTSAMLDTLREEEKGLLIHFLPGNSRVLEVQQQIADNEAKKKQMETNYPSLLSVKVSNPDPKPEQPNTKLQDELISQTAIVAGLQSKISMLTNELADVQTQFASVDSGSSAIAQLERTRKLQEDHYIYYAQALENWRINETLGSGKASNIDTIQQPSPPYFDDSKVTKARLGICVFSVLLALGLAFLIELYIDHSVKRPADIEARLGVPLFISIPYLNGNTKKRLLKAPPKEGLVLRSAAVNSPVVLNGSKTTIGRLPDNTVPIEDGSISLHHCEIVNRNGEVVVKDLGSTMGTFLDGERIVEGTLKAGQMLRVGNVEFHVEDRENATDLPVPAPLSTSIPPWDPRHALRPFYDTLRDRLITYFEVKNLTHKPKLVALTSCGDRSGVTSTAAGLAAALSETGEGNVLLVDMNVEQGAAHHFYKGHLSCGIDEALTKDKRHEARVQDNLYVVTESSNAESLPRVLPKRFTSLVPKLKASDFDYIIFDMPPMSQISITPRLAKFMDMIMVVVESEKTDRDVVQRAVSMLTETRANVGVVLNKRKHYVPQRIQQEL